MIGEIRQIGYVFKNIDERIKDAEKLLGIKFDRFSAVVKKNIFKEKIEPYKLDFGIARLGNIQLEYIQPLEGKTIYDPYMKEKGEGFHHIGIFTDEFEKHYEQFKSNGIKELTNGIVLGQKFAYFDTSDTVGYICELLAMPKKKK
ncbi:MAG: VOC family protein [Candidatus Helarchaeota archaeon]